MAQRGVLAALLLATTVSVGTPVSQVMPAAAPAYRQAGRIAVIELHGAIDRVSATSFQRRLDRALRNGAEAIVVELDTPGGELMATLNICHALKARAPANTVAWVRPQAFSAGTIIALACREIVLAPDASFGDSAPVSPLGPIPLAERAKLEAPILAEVIDSARRRHLDENLVQAFVSVGVSLWLVEHVEDGRYAFVTAEEYRAGFGEDPPEIFTPVVPAGERDAGVSPLFSFFPSPPGSGPPADEEIAFLQTRPPSRATLTTADRGAWQLLRQVTASDRLLSLKPDEAIFYGLATTLIADEQALRGWFGATDMQRLRRTWSESLVRFLISWPVRGVLIAFFLIGIFLEIAAPGSSVFGVAAVAALMVLLGAPLVAGMAQWWDILLVLVGVALIGTELFVLPGLGVLGIAGVLCLFAGLVGTFITDDIFTPQGQSDLVTGVLTTFTGIFIAGVGIWFVVRNMQSIPLFGRIVLTADIDTPVGPPARRDHVRPQPGDRGVSRTDLRPSGRVEFDGRIVDATAMGSYIEVDTPVRVVRAGLSVRVEEIEP